MKVMLWVVSCLLTLGLIQGHYWSGWYDRDDPTGTGDWETLNEQKALGYVCEGCKPIAAECRVKGTTSIFTRWSGTAPDNLMINCLPTKGLLCLKEDQPSNICSDYEIRYLCPSTSGTWTEMLDRDDPTATGDWEDTNNFRTYENNNLCNGGRTVGAKCRDIPSKKAYYDTGDRFNDDHMCNWENGLVCTTAVNGKECKDYEVQFKCPEICTCADCACAKWTSWLDRDNPSGNGDYEAVSSSGHNPCSGHDPIDIECRVRGTNQAWDQTGQVLKTPCTPSEGLVCNNVDQPAGMCLDYEVRFLCP